VVFNNHLEEIDILSENDFICEKLLKDWKLFSYMAHKMDFYEVETDKFNISQFLIVKQSSIFLCKFKTL